MFQKLMILQRMTNRRKLRRNSMQSLKMQERNLLRGLERAQGTDTDRDPSQEVLPVANTDLPNHVQEADQEGGDGQGHAREALRDKNVEPQGHDPEVITEDGEVDQDQDQEVALGVDVNRQDQGLDPKLQDADVGRRACQEIERKH